MVNYVAEASCPRMESPPGVQQPAAPALLPVPSSHPRLLPHCLVPLPVTAPGEGQRILGKPSTTIPVSPRSAGVPGGQASYSGNPLSRWLQCGGPQNAGNLPTSSGMITCNLALGAPRRQPGDQPGKDDTGPCSERLPRATSRPSGSSEPLSLPHLLVD